MRARVAVFIDYENVRRTARGAFARPSAPGWFGHVRVDQLAWRLADAVPHRVLVATHVFRGEPDAGSPSRSDFLTHRDAWNGLDGVTVHTVPNRRGVEKGVDNKLALTMAFGAWSGQFDVGIIVSGDNDFLVVREVVSPVVMEVAGWYNAAVPMPGCLMDVPRDVRCHRLDRDAFLAVAEEGERARTLMSAPRPVSAMRQAFIDAGTIRPRSAAA